MDSFEQRLERIEQRNATVESNKAWETSLTRRALLLLFTYILIGLYLFAIRIMHPWMNAIVPAMGFMIGTLTMPFFKKIWLKRHK